MQFSREQPLSLETDFFYADRANFTKYRGEPVRDLTESSFYGPTRIEKDFVTKIFPVEMSFVSNTGKDKDGNRQIQIGSMQLTGVLTKDSKYKTVDNCEEFSGVVIAMPFEKAKQILSETLDSRVAGTDLNPYSL